MVKPSICDLEVYEGNHIDNNLIKKLKDLAYLGLYDCFVLRFSCKYDVDLDILVKILKEASKHFSPSKIERFLQYNFKNIRVLCSDLIETLRINEENWLKSAKEIFGFEDEKEIEEFKKKLKTSVCFHLN